MVTTERVWDALRSVSDPEYPLSIVELGMVYGVRLDQGTAEISMTFTSIGCPAMDMIATDMRDAVLAVPGIDAVNIEVVWSPPWTKDCISEQGKKALAMYGVAN